MRWHGLARLGASVAAFALAAMAPVGVGAAQAQTLTAAQTSALDRDIETILARMSIPSASIAVIRNGKMAYLHAYGSVRLRPPTKATVDSRYQVGSVSKQFTAAALLLLEQDGKLSLDDPISRYAPGVTDGDRITIRDLLSHTAGYADYTPVDYLPIEQQKPTTPQAIVDAFAKGPMDFQPGEDWRYCNTCYVIAGLIVEKVSGQSLDDFLNTRIFHPLGMEGGELDDHPMGPGDAEGYSRYAFGPLRPAPAVGRNWFFATGDLTFRAEDLALWDLALIDHKLFDDQRYRELFTEAKLKNGKGVSYSLGFELRKIDGRQVLQHGGNVPGFVSYNRIYPDDRAAIVVLMNTDFGGPARDAVVERIAREIEPGQDEMFADREMFDALRLGKLRTDRLTPHAQAYFTPQVRADYSASLKPLGAPIRMTRRFKYRRGGLTGEAYNVIYPDRTIEFDLFKTEDGRYEELMVFNPS